MSSLHWYALAVHARQEKAAAAAIAQLGLELYLPVRQERRAWSDRIKNVEVALFPGYLFVRVALDGARLRELLGVRQVFEVVGRLPAPRVATAIPDTEIDNLRRALASEARFEPTEALRVGREVEVGAGPLRGVRGIIVEAPAAPGEAGKGRPRHLVVQIQLLGRGVRARLDPDDVL